MIDLFESIIKSHTVVIIAEYVKHNKLSEAAKGMFSQGLRTPSLGTWQLFSRILSEELNADGYAWTFTGFPKDFAALDKALNATKTNVISFRNGYAHGATPTDFQCESDIRQFEPFLIQLLDSHWLSNTTLENRDNKVCILSDTGELCLHPIFLSKDEGGSSPYAFFNDLKNDKVGLLNYPLSKHYREKQFYQEFHQYLPLNEWKKSGNNEFYQRIEELTETFKGRTIERARLLDFVSNNSKGYFSIQGNPGIGKSALIAQFFKDLKSHKDTQQLQVVEYFIRRGTAQAQLEYVLNYLIRRTDELFQAGREIRAEGKAVWELQQQLFSKWRLWGEQSKGGKLLFLIDGLDEGVENSVVTYLPRENFEGILIIYGSRPGGHKSIDDLWAQLPAEHHTKLELSGLGKEDIRALIYEVANKYELDRDSAWIDAVQRRSQGNPLYLKLLCDAMEHGSIVVNDIGALPEKIDEYYKAILDRYSRDADGDALLNALFTFAAARDYLTMAHLGLINKLGEATVQRIGSTLKEVLYENPLTEEVLDYQLFHESFREYLIKEKGASVREAAERIIDFCEGWNELEGTWEQRYALEHYAAHLGDSKKELRVETLSKLIYDHGYRATQKKVLKGFDASNEMYRIALKKSSELKREDDMLEAALCLVDLKYEEANDAPKIVEMIKKGEIDLALKRLESFGGSDKEGLKRKFILYIICLTELVINRKDSVINKSAIKDIIYHLDDNIPSDLSLFCWEDFFSPKFIFIIVCELKQYDIDFRPLYNKTYNGLIDWVNENDVYTKMQIATLLEICRNGKHINNIIGSLVVISKNLANNKQIDITMELLSEAIHLNTENDHGFSKFYNLTQIANIFVFISNYDKALVLMTEAEKFLNEIEEYQNRMSGFVLLSDWYLKNNDLKRAERYNSILENDKYYKDWSMQDLAYYYVRNNNLKKGEEIALSLNGEHDRFIVLKGIFDCLINDNYIEEPKRVLTNCIELTQKIEDEFNRSYAIFDVIDNLLKFDEIDNAIDIIKKISLVKLRVNAYLKASKYYHKKGFVEYSKKYFNLSLNLIDKIRDDWDRDEAIEYLILFYLDNNDLVLALENVSKLSTQTNKKDDLSRVIISKLIDANSSSEYFNLLTYLQHCDKSLNQELKLKNISDLIQCSKCKISSENKIILFDAIGFDRLNPLLFKIYTNNLFSISHYELCFNILDILLVSIDKIESFQARIECMINLLSGVPQQYLEKYNLNTQSILQYLESNSDLNDKSIIIKNNFSLLKSLFPKETIAILLLNKIEQVNSIINDSPNFTTQSEILINLAFCFLDCGDSIQFELLIDKAFFLIINEQKNISQRIHCLIQVTNGLISIDHLLIAKPYLDQAFELAIQLRENDFMRKVHLQNISISYFNINEICDSEKVIDFIKFTERSQVFKNISLKYISKDNFTEGLTNIYQIDDLGVRYKAFQEMAYIIYKNYNYTISFEKINLLSEDIAKKNYLLGIALNMTPFDCDITFLFKYFSMADVDTICIEQALQLYFLNDFIFNTPSIEMINRFNKTLNIQWALDIISKFSKDESLVRSSSNLTDWIKQIQDEDDRDQISLWAKKVAKGKISESEFEEKIKDII
jgi:hypothetical protein